MVTGQAYPKKAAAGFLAALFLILHCIAPVLAAQIGNVYDDADILTEEEIVELNGKLSAFSEESGWSIYAVTTDHAGGRTSRQYADDFFDAHSAGGEDGAALLIDLDNREITISTCGAVIRFMTDQRIERTLDDAFAYVSDGAYKDCFLRMLSGLENAYEDGVPEGQYNYDEQTGEISRYRQITGLEALLAGLVACIVGVIVFMAIIGSYRLKFGVSGYDARQFGSVSLSRNEDVLIGQHISHHRIQTSGGGATSNHSGTRSTTHHSSSGRSHGGGSRKF